MRRSAVDKGTISALVPTFNSSSTIAATLESLKWADEIVVIDSFSTDDTLDVARNYGAKIVCHEYRNSAAQKNVALAECSGQWILQVDSDEIVSSGLREE